MADWRPDWRSEESYAFADSLSLHYWAWEFLRRNGDYQKDWDEVQRAYQQAVAQVGRANVFSSQSAVRHLWKQWGIQGFVNPGESHPTSLIFQHPKQIVATQANEQHDPVTIRLGQHEILVKFKLQDALERQFAEARTLLNFIQKMSGVKVEKQRRPKTNWKLYLRILDARAAGATYATIASTLFSLSPQAHPEKTAEDAARRAKKMTMPAGYLGIL